MHKEKSVMFRFELASKTLLDKTYRDMRAAILKANPIVSKYYSVRKSEFGQNSIIVRVVLNPEINIARHLVPTVGLCAGRYLFTLIDYTEIDEDDRDVESRDELFTFNIPESCVDGFICNMDFKDYD